MLYNAERESNRFRRRKKRNLSREISKARKAGEYHMQDFFNATTKYAAHIHKYWHSSGNFNRMHAYAKSEREFHEAARYADY